MFNRSWFQGCKYLYAKYPLLGREKQRSIRRRLTNTTAVFQVGPGGNLFPEWFVVGTQNVASRRKKPSSDIPSCSLCTRTCTVDLAWCEMRDEILNRVSSFLDL